MTPDAAAENNDPNPQGQEPAQQEIPAANPAYATPPPEGLPDADSE